MASLAEIRGRVEVILTDVAQAAGLTVLPLVPGSTPVLPALVVKPGGAQYASRPAQRGMTTYEFELLLLVSGSDLDVAQAALDDLLVADGPASIRGAFTRQAHLGLSDGTTAWIDGMEYGVANPWAQQALDVLGASLRLVVRTTG